MNRALALILTVIAMLLPGTAALAQPHEPGGSRVVARASWVEEWDPASARWVQVHDRAADISNAAYEPATSTPATSTPATFTPATFTRVTRADGIIITETITETVTESVFAQPTRFIGAAVQSTRAELGRGSSIAQFGPFRVIDATRAALMATTDAASPQAFAAMLAAHPGLEVIEFVDAPGTNHDLANLALGRAIRAAGLTTHVPAGGSARSGAVELFLAGTRRTAAPGALFAVHSWRDERGREPADFAADAPENRLYLDFYAEMGMSADDARDFYAMTNSVPHSGALWLENTDMARWIALGDDSLPQPAAREPAVRVLEPVAVEHAKPVPMQWAMHHRARDGSGTRFDAAAKRLPVLAYADVGAAAFGLLDSRMAFP